MCKPLCENEFCSAIGENYYTPSKFHFGLSYGQVIKLINLFYSRKINIQPEKITEKLKNTSAGESNKLAGKKMYLECRSSEHNRIERKREARRQPPLLSTHFATTSMHHSIVETERVSDPINLRSLSYPESVALDSQRGSICLLDDSSKYRLFSIGKQQSSSEMEYIPLPLQPSSNSDVEYVPLPLLSNHSATTSTCHNIVDAERVSDPMNLSSLSYLESDRGSVRLLDDGAKFRLFSFGKKQNSLELEYIPLSLQSSSTSSEEYIPLPVQSPFYTPNSDIIARSPYMFDGNDACNNSVVIPRISKVEGEYVLTSLLDDTKNALFRSEIAQRTYLSSRLRNQAFRIPDYSSLLEESQQKHANAEAESSSQEHSEYAPFCIPNTRFENYNICYDDDDDDFEELNCPINGDYDPSRTGVISYFSRNQNARNHEASKLFLSAHSARRDRWSPMKASKQPRKFASGKDPCGRSASPETLNRSGTHRDEIAPPPARTIERRRTTQYECVSDISATNTKHDGFIAAPGSEPSSETETVADECVGLPFYNFKRRKFNAVNRGDEAEVMKSKRRLIRPFSYENMNQNAKKEAEVKAPAQGKLEFENAVSELQTDRKCELLINQLVEKSEFENDISELQTDTICELKDQLIEKNHLNQKEGL